MSLELSPVDARRLAFHRRRPLVHIQGPYLDGRYSAYWWDDIHDLTTRHYVEKETQAALIDALEDLERDGCRFGPVVELDGHGVAVRAWSGLGYSAEGESEQPRFDARSWRVRES